MGGNASLDSHRRLGSGFKKLIEAVVASLDGDEDPPPVLRLSWMSKKYGALPEAGGVMDQEYAMLHRMDIVSNIHDAISRLRGFKGDAIHGMSTGDRRLIKSLRDMGLV